MIILVFVLEVFVSLPFLLIYKEDRHVVLTAQSAVSATWSVAGGWFKFGILWRFGPVGDRCCGLGHWASRMVLLRLLQRLCDLEQHLIGD